MATLSSSNFFLKSIFRKFWIRFPSRFTFSFWFAFFSGKLKTPACTLIENEEKHYLTIGSNWCKEWKNVERWKVLIGSKCSEGWRKENAPEPEVFALFAELSTSELKPSIQCSLSINTTISKLLFNLSNILFQYTFFIF